VPFLLFLALSCSPPVPEVDPGPVTSIPEETEMVPSPQKPATMTPDRVETFEATLTVDPAPGYKHFQGVWLERTDGDRWVIDYRARDCWTPFDRHRVRITGERYTPMGQAIDAVHFRVERLEVVDPTSFTSLVSVGPEKTLSGRVQQVTGEPGTKMEGDSWLVFTTGDGTAHQLFNPSVVSDRVDAEVSITGRSVERSPYATHMPGPTLCIGSVRDGA